MIRANITPWALAIAYALDEKARSMEEDSFTPRFLLQSVMEEHPRLDLPAAGDTAKLLNDIGAALAEPGVKLVSILAVEDLLAVKAVQEPMASVRFAINPTAMILNMADTVGGELSRALPKMLEFLDLRKE
jgi:hypothetical protein